MLFDKFGLKSRNIHLLVYSDLVSGFIFFLPILALYLERELFTVANVAIIYAIQSVCEALFEVPTGAIADLFGRKRTYLAGIFLDVIGVVILFLGGDFSIFILYAIINAAGRSLMSGTDGSLIYDTLKEEGKTKYHKEILSIFYAIWPLGAIIGSAVGGYLATISLSLPIIASVIPLAIGFFLACLIKEPVYHKETHKNVVKQMWNASSLVLKNSQLLILMIAGFIMLGAGESVHYLKSIFFRIQRNTAFLFLVSSLQAFFGFSFSGALLFHILLQKRIGDRNTLLLSAIASPVLLFLAVITGGILSVVFIVLTSIPYGLRNPVIEHLFECSDCIIKNEQRFFLYKQPCR